MKGKVLKAIGGLLLFGAGFVAGYCVSELDWDKWMDETFGSDEDDFDDDFEDDFDEDCELGENASEKDSKCECTDTTSTADGDEENA